MLYVAITLGVGIGNTFANEDGAAFKFYSSDKSFADAKFDLENAIIEKGLKIDYAGDPGRMLQRTADDVDGSGQIYKGSAYMQFCSALVSRKAMKADPRNIAFCPYTVYVFETVADPGVTRLGYRVASWPGPEESNQALKSTSC